MRVIKAPLKFKYTGINTEKWKVVNTQNVRAYEQTVRFRFFDKLFRCVFNSLKLAFKFTSIKKNRRWNKNKTHFHQTEQIKGKQRKCEKMGHCRLNKYQVRVRYNHTGIYTLRLHRKNSNILQV